MGRKKSRFYNDPERKREIVNTNVSMLAPGEACSVPESLLKVAPSAPTISSRRQKLMANYISKKLKKDARPLLMERLQNAAYLGEGLQSTKKLLLPVIPLVQTLMICRDESDAEELSESDNEVEKVTGPISPTVFATVAQNDDMDFRQAVKSVKYSPLNPLLDEECDANDTTAKEVESSDSESGPEEAETQRLPPWQTYFVLVERNKEIMEQREKLPIFAEEQRIMELLRQHPVSIICGETGSGKTTQVPQFLYEAGFGDPAGPNPGLIGVTQPRRVAATSMARRVGEELGRPDQVSYQIRYDGTVSRQTRIKFMTDGIMLRELGDDFLLQKYSVILLDEAHERNLNTDILIGMLSRVVKLRNRMALEQPDQIRPLRLIVMSATLNVKDFQAPRLFSPRPPLIQVDARQHPVTVHFARRTDIDHVEAAYKMATKVHANLPPGGILIFLTGKQEISKLASKLRRKFSPQRAESCQQWREEARVAGDEYDSEDDDMVYQKGTPLDTVQEAKEPSPDSDEDIDEEEEEEEFSMGADTKEPLYVLPLYSLLAPEEQQKVFQPPPAGHRLCILATNVAETSLTIPNIRYVIDAGLVKQKHHDASTGAIEYRLEWTSKASATQRAGRAGRVGPGHCYRLYSSAVFDQQFSEYSVPEILRTPIESLVLQLKTMGIDHAERFPLPSPPESEAVIAAQKSLLKLGALSGASNAPDIKITNLGRKMSKLPLAPLWSRFVIVAVEGGASPTMAIALAAALAVGDPFVDSAPQIAAADDTGGQSKTHSLRQVQLELAGKPPTSDLLLWLNAFIRYYNEAPISRREYCSTHQLMPKRMEEMTQQYRLLLRILRPVYAQIDWTVPLITPSTTVSRTIRKLIAQSLSDRVAERVSKVVGRKRALPAYRLLSLPADDPNSIVYLHPSSVVKSLPPAVLVYTELASVVDDTSLQSVRYLKYDKQFLFVLVPGLLMERSQPDTTDSRTNSSIDASSVPITSIPHHLPRKAPPHMRRLDVTVTSPSDNLSPCSQKVMNIAKGPKPRSFKSMLGLEGAQQPERRRSTGLTASDSMHDNSLVEGESGDEEDLESDRETDQDVEEDEPLSQSPSSRSPGRGGLVRHL